MFFKYHSQLVASVQEVVQELYPEVGQDFSVKLSTVGSFVSEAKEYDELVFGSSICIKTANILRALGVSISPENVASRLLESINDPILKPGLFIASSVFLNFRPDISRCSEFIVSQDLRDGLFLDNAPRVINISPVNIEVRTEISNEFKEEKIQKIITLSQLSNPEFDIDSIRHNRNYFDNPLFLLSKIDEILNSYNTAKTEDIINIRRDNNASLYAVPASKYVLNLLDQLGRTLIVRNDYLVYDSFRRSSPHLYFAEIVSFFKAFISLWNDPWGRLALSGVSFRVDCHKVEYAVKIAKIFTDNFNKLLLEQRYLTI